MHCEPDPAGGRGHSLNVTCSSAIGKGALLEYEPWQRLPGVARKRNVLRS